MTRQDGRFVLVIKQDDTVLTLFFEDLELEVHLYENMHILVISG